MATHDYVIANQGFPAFRSDLNNALAAIVSNNSSATEPTTMFAHMIWVDTAANPSILKIRNADNDAWITIGSIDQTGDTFTLVNLRTSGPVVFNDAGADVDFRVEGDTDANLLFVDASADAVGIGTNAPAAKLHITDSGNTTADGIRLTLGSEARDHNIYSAISTGRDLIIAPYRGLSINTGSGFTEGVLTLNGYEYTAFGTGSSNTERARITSGGFLKASNNGSYISSAGTYHEMVSNQAGSVVTSFRNTSTSDPYGIYLDFTGTDPNNATNYMFRAEISGVGNVYTIFSNGTTSARSDAKWKKNIETARDGYIDDLARLRVVKYNWYNHEDGTPKEMGLIAQEVEEVFPGLVQEDEEKRDEVRTREIPAVLDEDGNEVEPARTEEYTEKVGTGEYTKSIKFSVFTPMLIKAVQELKAITDTQAQTIAALEARIAALENA